MRPSKPVDFLEGLLYYSLKFLTPLQVLVIIWEIYSNDILRSSPILLFY